MTYRARHGDQIKLFALDVTDESGAASAVKAAIGAFGSVIRGRISQD